MSRPDRTRRTVLVQRVRKFGDLCLRAGDVEAARRFFEDGLAIRKRLADAEPDHPQYRDDLRWSLGKLIECDEAAGVYSSPYSAALAKLDACDLRGALALLAASNDA